LTPWQAAPFKRGALFQDFPDVPPQGEERQAHLQPFCSISPMPPRLTGAKLPVV
jgi:hypothetical protein